jgi:TrmH family RNA methyltransferase
MYSPKIKRYQKKFEYSYAFGAYPVLDLLRTHPESLYKVLLRSDTDQSDGITEIKEICNSKGIEFEYADRLIEKISVKENTYVVGVFKKYDSKLDSTTNHIVLDNPTNMGNMGTIIRTMLGFGFKNLAIIKPSADIFDPMVIRSTMGALFSINFEFFNSIEEYKEKFNNYNLYMFMLDGAKDIKEVEFKEPLSIVQGNESKGLPESYKSLGESVYIPHSKDIDSLNLSVATAISMWEVSKRKLS